MLSRKFAREWVLKYHSVAKVNEAIAGARRMGSERSVENYVKAVGKFVAFLGNQQIVTSYEDQGNSTYRMLHSDRFNVAGDMEVSVGLPNNSTQALFIRLKAAQRYNCGSIKIKIEGTLGVSYWCWLRDQGFGTYVYLPIKVETTFILPIFIRD